jgi:hypothetical protein
MKKQKYTRTPEQEQRFDAFQVLARELMGEVTQDEGGRSLKSTASSDTKQLATRARELPGLQRYSLYNQLLILKQRPGAVEVHGFAGWRERGYRVKRGEKVIYIRAPRSRADGEEGIAGFSTKRVFDQDQVEPIPEGEQGQEKAAQADNED